MADFKTVVFESSYSQRVAKSRLIALCFVAELQKRRAWRIKCRQLLGFYSLAVAHSISPGSSSGEAVSDISALSVIQRQAVVEAVFQALRDHEEVRPFRINCASDTYEPSLLACVDDTLSLLRENGIAI